MTREVEQSFNTFLSELRKQFLCCYPLHCIRWQDFPKNLTWQQQQELIESTFNHILNRQRPVKLSYQLNFLKHLIAFLERHYSEIHDVVYESYCQLQSRLAQDAAQKYAYKHYIVSADTQLTLRESKSFVADGTTGLCTWQASLALADYLLHHPHIVHNCNVLELGAGTGLCGLIATRCCAPKRILLTDGSAVCVDLIREGILHNFPEAIETASNCFTIDHRILETHTVSWSSIEEVEAVKQLEPEVILAGDVVYDSSVFEDLVHAIDYVFNLKHNQVTLLLAATVRSEHTLSEFLSKLADHNFSITEQPEIALEDSRLYWDRTTPVRILRITRDFKHNQLEY